MDAFVSHGSFRGSDDGGTIAGVGQKRVDHRDHLRALADGGGDPFGRSRPHVTDREHAVAARPERQVPIAEIRARTHEALGVEHDVGFRQPVGVRFRTNEQEDMSERLARLRRRRRTAPADRLEDATPSLEGRDLRLQQHLDVSQPADAVDQIARHARAEARAAHEKPHLVDLARQIHDRLPRGVAGAHQRNLLSAAELPLQRRGPVVDARALEHVEIRRRRGAGIARRSRSRRYGRSPAHRLRDRAGTARHSARRRTAGEPPRPESRSRPRTSAPGCTLGPSARCR